MMTIEEMIRRYNIAAASDGINLAIRGVAALKRDNAVEMLKANKPAILAYLKEQEEAKKTAARNRAAKINAIEGLTEIRHAIDERIEYRAAFDRMMSDEDNDGARMPKQPETDLIALKARYPRATAFLKAEEWEHATNFIKSGYGKTAKEKIINGEDFNAAIAEMEAAWNTYINEQMD